MKKQYVNAFMDQKGIAYFGDKWDDIWDAEGAWLDELDRLSTTALVGDVQWMGVWTLRIPEIEEMAKQARKAREEVILQMVSYGV